jgi:hypothetical protein
MSRQFKPKSFGNLRSESSAGTPELLNQMAQAVGRRREISRVILFIRPSNS